MLAFFCHLFCACRTQFLSHLSDFWPRVSLIVANLVRFWCQGSWSLDSKDKVNVTIKYAMLFKMGYWDLFTAVVFSYPSLPHLQYLFVFTRWYSPILEEKKEVNRKSLQLCWDIRKYSINLFLLCLALYSASQ